MSSEAAALVPPSSSARIREQSPYLDAAPSPATVVVESEAPVPGTVSRRRFKPHVPLIVRTPPEDVPEPEKSNGRSEVRALPTGGQSADKPPNVAAPGNITYEWVRKGPGWDCREITYPDGRRKRTHLGHMGKARWEEMRRNYPEPDALQAAVAAWIEAKRAEKNAIAGQGGGDAGG